MPSQVGGAVAEPFMQIAAPHITVPSGNPQAVLLVPLHVPTQPAVPVHLARRVPRGAPLVTLAQVPSWPVSPHDSHWPVQALSQQKPSTQLPPRQSCAPVHDWPCFALHTPFASQLFVPLQVSSVAEITGTHAPPPPVQAWHVPHVACVQQKPSIQ